MDVHVTLEGRGDRSERIFRQLHQAIAEGLLRPGEKLPPTRELARQLDVSRNTVAIAYERLAAEGYVSARVGAGTYVEDEYTRRRAARRAPSGSDVHPRAFWRDVAPEPEEATTRYPYDFRVGVPDATLFPYATWRRLVADEIRASASPGPYYGDPRGHEGLRAAIARHVGVSRAVRAAAADVVVTQGAQQALDLVGRVLIEPGDTVAVEEPGYRAARRLFASLGARVVGVPVDVEGLDVAALPDDARLVYTTPSHQYPLGLVMSAARRADLLAWAGERDAIVVEDDYDTEFRYGDRPLEPLQSLDRAGRVLYVGTFSKTLLPSLRQGFLVAPASLQTALREAKRVTDWHGAATGQGALARFLDDGLFGRHLRKAGRAYAERHAALTGALDRHLGGVLEPISSQAGLHVCTRLAPGVDADVDAVLVRAAAAGVGAQNLALYCGERPVQAGVVLGLGALAPAAIEPGIRRLAAAFAAAR